MASSRHPTRDASTTSAALDGPTGYILSYGASYKGTVVYKGAVLGELPACPPSAIAAHDAFVSKCGFSREFSPGVDEVVTKRRMVEDVRRAATTMASGDVVVVFFSGHGVRMDGTACVIDGTGCVVSVRKLQAVFAETVVERGSRGIALVVVLDCCQVLCDGKSVAGWCLQAQSNPLSWSYACAMQAWSMKKKMIEMSSTFMLGMRRNARTLWARRRVSVRWSRMVTRVGNVQTCGADCATL